MGLTGVIGLSFLTFSRYPHIALYADILQEGYLPHLTFLAGFFHK